MDNLENHLSDRTRYFEIAGITVQVESDLPITDATFDKKFASFRVDGPGCRHRRDPAPFRPAAGDPRIRRVPSRRRGLPQAALGHLSSGGVVGLPGHRAGGGRSHAAPRGRVQRRPLARRHLQHRAVRTGVARRRPDLADHVPHRPDPPGAPAGRPAGLLPALRRPHHRRAGVRLRGPLRRRQVDDHGAGPPGAGRRAPRSCATTATSCAAGRRDFGGRPGSTCTAPGATATCRTCRPPPLRCAPSSSWSSTSATRSFPSPTGRRSGSACWPR